MTGPSFAQAMTGDPEPSSYLLTEVAGSIWFSLASGIASILGLLVAVYPMQARGAPPSVFRSLLWQRSLLLSFGLGLTVFGSIQFYNQGQSPMIPEVAVFHMFLRGWDSLKDDHMSGPLVWIIVLIIGLVLLLVGASQNPAMRISEMVMDDIDKIRRRQKRHLELILSKRSYEELNESDQQLYDQTRRTFQTIEARIVEMYTGVIYRNSNVPNEDILESAETVIKYTRQSEVGRQ